MADPLVSPVTGNPLNGNASFGYTDSVTGQFFTSDEIVGSVEEVQTGPVELLLGGGGLAGMGRRGLGALFGSATKTPKKPSPCPTCAGTRNAKNIRQNSDADPAAQSDGTTYRGDSRSPDQIQNSGGFQGQDPNATSSLDDHMAGNRDPSQWVSTSTDPEAASWYGANPNAQPGQGGGWVYQIQQPGGVNVGETSIGPNVNSEVAYSNGVPWSNVSGYAQVPEGAGPTSMGFSGAPTEWTPNPSFVPK